MKKQLLFLLVASTTIICTLDVSFGSESDLVDLMSTSLKGAGISARLEPSSSLPDNDGSRQKIKQIEAFGINFSGQAAFKETSLQSVSLWCDDSRLAPDAAFKAFSQIADALHPRIGNGKLIKDVPSFEDATDPKKQVMLWTDKNEIIVLSMDTYPIRAGLSLQRNNLQEWLAEMGADQGEFWNKTLKANGVDTPPLSIDSPSSKSQSSQAPDGVSKPVTQPSKSEKTAKAKPTPRSNEFTSSTPWFVVAALIVVVISLMVLLLKWRK